MRSSDDCSVQYVLSDIVNIIIMICVGVKWSALLHMRCSDDPVLLPVMLGLILFCAISMVYFFVGYCVCEEPETLESICKYPFIMITALAVALLIVPCAFIFNIFKLISKEE